MSKTSHRVCVLSYQGLCFFEFGIAMEVFALPRPEFDNWYECEVVAVDDGPLHSVGGVSVNAPNGSEFSCAELTQAFKRASLVIVPGWGVDKPPVSDKLKQALVSAVQSGTRIASICSGVFLLAECGLLTGKRVTTHWRYADLLQKRYPSLEVDPNVLFIDEGSVLTSAGSAAGLDLCLYLVRTDYGSEIANHVARRLVLPAYREGGQAQFIPRPVPERIRNNKFSGLLDEVRRCLNEHWSIDKMANYSHLSSRTLLRRFREHFNETPTVWLTRERLAHARTLLETTKLDLEVISDICGFSSPDLLRHHFKKHFNITPKAYRISFEVKN